ncbi:hypothetical protein D3C80_1347460 [compost metagenome]
MVAIQDAGEADVDALGEQGMVFDQGARAAHEGVVLAVGEEDHVRIAHGDGAGRVQHRGVDRPDLKLDAARVHLFGQRHLGPVEARRAHVHRHQVRRDRRPLDHVEGTSRPDAA